VNRIWFHLMGRGDRGPRWTIFRADQPPEPPSPCWMRLAKDFRRQRVRDVRHMIRLIMASRTLRPSRPTPNETNAGDGGELFATCSPAGLTAEQFLDAEATRVAGVPAEFRRPIRRACGAGQIFRRLRSSRPARGAGRPTPTSSLATFGKPPAAARLRVASGRSSDTTPRPEPSKPHQRPRRSPSPPVPQGQPHRQVDRQPASPTGRSSRSSTGPP